VDSPPKKFLFGGGSGSSWVGRKEKKKRKKEIYGDCTAPISLSVYCKNNQTISYNSLAHLRLHK
jgi:hypothetical protein